MEGLVDSGAELAALRRRAYAADADIQDDPAAFARLAELEDLARLSRATAAAGSAPEHGLVRAAADEEPDATAVVAASPLPSNAPAETAITVTAVATTPRTRPRRHAALVAGTAVLAVALAGAASAERVPAVPAPDARLAAAFSIPAVDDQPWASSQEGYMEFLDSLREDVLEGADADRAAGRIIRDKLRPYGGMNGRSVWAGPTIDGTLCLVVSDEEAPVIACALPETVEARGISIVLPAGHADSDAEAVFPPGQSIRYTLGPDMSVTTQPATD